MVKSLLYAVKRPFHLVKTGWFQGVPAEIRNRFPAKKLTIIGITGTDGKTTSSTLLHHVLTSSGIKAGLVSTVAAYIGDQQIDTGFHVTTPQPSQLHRFLRQLVDQGFSHLVLEATSHGLYQYRTWGMTPQFAGVTNIDREHLDYHLDYKRYVAAKAFLLKQAKVTVLNEDDTSYRYLRPLLKKQHIQTYSAEDKLPAKVVAAIKGRFPEDYNQMNARLVYRLSQNLVITDEQFIKGVETFATIPGRMEFVDTGLPFEVIVDFAHTPQGLESSLSAVKKRMRQEKRSGKLIAVFGCAGLRDFAKRPLMGKIGTDLADIAVFTAEDPRTENIWSIIRQMKEQLASNHDRVVSIADRREAIEFALKKLAQKGDTVIILGKGHEQSMCYGTTEYPWSDKQAVLEISSEIKRKQ